MNNFQLDPNRKKKNNFQCKSKTRDLTKRFMIKISVICCHFRSLKDGVHLNSKKKEKNLSKSPVYSRWIVLSIEIVSVYFIHCGFANSMHANRMRWPFVCVSISIENTLLPSLPLLFKMINSFKWFSVKGKNLYVEPSLCHRHTHTKCFSIQNCYSYRCILEPYKDTL